MQLFQINAMNVSRNDFKRELEKNGLKYGYIPRLYEKFKQGKMTCFRLVIEGYQFVVLTDDESSYPEIQEETGKKIEIEPYSLEWLGNLVYDANVIGPSFYESLMRHLQMYIRVKKAEKNDERKEQENCPYCHPPYKGIGGGDEVYEKDGEGVFVKDGKIVALADCGWIKFNEEIKLCPKCGRKLEAFK